MLRFTCKSNKFFVFSTETKTLPFDKFKDFLVELSQSIDTGNPSDAMKDIVKKLQLKRKPGTNDTTVFEKLQKVCPYTNTIYLRLLCRKLIILKWWTG